MKAEFIFLCVNDLPKVSALRGIGKLFGQRKRVERG